MDTICKILKIPTPQKEYRFEPTRRWRVDYCWPEWKLAIEIEGGVWSRGRHLRGGGFLKDMEKYNTLTIKGYHLLRFTPQELQQGIPISWIQAFMEMRKEGSLDAIWAEVRAKEKELLHAAFSGEPVTEREVKEVD